MRPDGRNRPCVALGVLATGAVVLAASTACHRGSHDFPSPDVAPTGTSSTQTTSTVPDPPPLLSARIEPQTWTPSGYLLLTRERLAELRKNKGGKDRDWQALQTNAERGFTDPDPYDSSPENQAVVYLVTGETRFAQGAFKLEQALEAHDVGHDSYLDFGDFMQSAAFVLNYCADALSADQKTELVHYLEKWTHELWFDNKGSGWGLNDVGNNYFMSFLKGTAYAAYALKAANQPSADKLIELFRNKVERPGGLLTYLSSRAKGGDWLEGVNYGERAKERMFEAFAAAASMGGPNYFTQTPFVPESILYAIYQLQPGKKFMAPTGDLPRDSAMPVSPYDRDYIQLATFYTNDAVARGYGAWLLKEVAPSYSTNSFNWRGEYYRDVLYPTPWTPTPPTNLPLTYRSPGTNWINARSGWDDRATSVTILAASVIDQSHAHCDTGSFVIWKGGWQAVDAVTYSKSGLIWEAGAHNMIQVAGSERRPGKSRGLVAYADAGDYLYAQVDATNLFAKRENGETATLLDELTREIVYVRPDTVVTYDRVAPKPAGKDYSWRFHFATMPTQDGGRYSATNEAGSASLMFLSDGAPKIAPDNDTDDKTTAWRVEVAPNATQRYAAIVSVANGAPPPLAATSVRGPGIEGIAWSNQVVVFSVAARGAPAALPFTYTIKGTEPRTQTLVNMGQPVDVSVTRDQTTTTVRVSAGSQLKPEQGVVHFTK